MRAFDALLCRVDRGFDLKMNCHEHEPGTSISKVDQVVVIAARLGRIERAAVLEIGDGTKR